MSLVPEMEAEMESYSESYEAFYELNCVCEMKPSKQEPNWDPYTADCAGCGPAIQVKLAAPKGPPTFRQAVVVVVALEKMKRLDRYLFRDNDLMELFSKVLVEDEVLFHDFESTSRADPGFRWFNERTFQITDAASKSMVLKEGPGQAQLVALHLQGANAERKVKLNMAFYTSLPPPNSRKRPVTLKIIGKELYLSCVMVNDQAELHLEEVNGMLPKSIRADLQRFLFYRGEDGGRSTFESASCPSWFISTSQDEGQLVAMSSSQNQTTIQHFRLFEEN